jgi:hypothetical protein
MESVSKGYCPPLPSDCPPEYASVVIECTQFDPSKRPTMAQTLERLEAIYKKLIEEEEKVVTTELVKIQSARELLPKSESMEMDETSMKDSLTRSVSFEGIPSLETSAESLSSSNTSYPSRSNNRHVLEILSQQYVSLIKSCN